MSELTMLIDTTSGAMLLEHSHLSADVLDKVTAIAGEGKECGCARPLDVIPPPTMLDLQTGEAQVRIAGYYHNSLVEGPGRRSSVLFQFCPLSCKGCWVPHLHNPDGGELVAVKTLAEKLLDPPFERDGVSILGGEPFAQPESLLALVKELRRRGCQHILCYSGFTLEALVQQAKKQPAIGEVLADIDMLIDGPYVVALADSAGAWTGSGNQRVIDLGETRRTGRTVLY
ncbi:MAG: radical SAM protein [Chloracidobacterium sp.]|nr:radical SAM protein [Chloracidobacterium sp.]MBK7804246.1 radical SAM protein [Chloracidobacterium sp.]